MKFLIAPEETYATSTANGISESTQSSRKEEQLQCLEDYLKTSNANGAAYLLVAGHYPIFSTGLLTLKSYRIYITF